MRNKRGLKQQMHTDLQTVKLTAVVQKKNLPLHFKANMEKYAKGNIKYKLKTEHLAQKKKLKHHKPPWCYS